MLLAGASLERAISHVSKTNSYYRLPLLVRAMRAVVQRVKRASVEVFDISECCARLLYITHDEAGSMVFYASRSTVRWSQALDQGCCAS